MPCLCVLRHIPTFVGTVWEVNVRHAYDLFVARLFDLLFSCLCVGVLMFRVFDVLFFVCFMC